MEQKPATSWTAIDVTQPLAQQAESLAKEIIAKGKAQGLDPEGMAEIYAAAFIGAALLSVSALASGDANNCRDGMNTILRVAGALGFKFSISNFTSPGPEARRDH